MNLKKKMLILCPRLDTYEAMFIADTAPHAIQTSANLKNVWLIPHPSLILLHHYRRFARIASIVLNSIWADTPFTLWTIQTTICNHFILLLLVWKIATLASPASVAGAIDWWKLLLGGSLNSRHSTPNTDPTDQVELCSYIYQGFHEQNPKYRQG